MDGAHALLRHAPDGHVRAGDGLVFLDLEARRSARWVVTRACLTTPVIAVFPTGSTRFRLLRELTEIVAMV